MATWTAFHSCNTCVKAVKCWPSDKLSYKLITIYFEGMQHNIYHHHKLKVNLKR